MRNLPKPWGRLGKNGSSYRKTPIYIRAIEGPHFAAAVLVKKEDHICSLLLRSIARLPSKSKPHREFSNLRVLQAGEGGCCSTCTLASGRRSTSTSSGNAVTEALYIPDEVAAVPEEAVLAFLGSDNPTTLISLHEGQTVLDLGSEGGIDVLLSARRVRPSGFVYGVDMTDEMLELAQENKVKGRTSGRRMSQLHHIMFGSGDNVICTHGKAMGANLPFWQSYGVGNRNSSFPCFLRSRR